MSTNPESKASPVLNEGHGMSLEVSAFGDASVNKEDLLALEDVDPALDAKMHIVNNVRLHAHKRHQLRPTSYDWPD